MCLFISVCVLLKTLLSRVFWVNLTFNYGNKTKLPNKTCTQPIEQEPPPTKQKGGPESVSQCSANNRRVLPIRSDLFKNKTDTALSLLTDEYISRAFARRDRWTQLVCVFTLTLNPSAFSHISRLDVPRSAADRVTSETERWQVWHEASDSRTVTTSWFVTPSRTVYWAIKIVRLAEELRFHSETFILLATKHFRIWESRDWLAFTVFTFLKRFHCFILKQF